MRRGAAPRPSLGGPVVYSHVGGGHQEQPGHPDNAFWPQATAAYHVYELLNEHAQALAEVDELPCEFEIDLREQPQGAPVALFPSKAGAGTVKANSFTGVTGNILACEAVEKNCFDELREFRSPKVADIERASVWLESAGRSVSDFRRILLNEPIP